MDDELKINLRQRDNACVVDLIGDLTIAAQGAFDQLYLAIAQTGAHTVVINLAGSEYVTSNGMSVLAGLIVQARREDRRVCLAGLTPHLQKLCRMMGLTSYAEIHNTEEDVLRTAPKSSS
jgi:anti-anti-sigma factor